jgi:Ca-activated chloride channel family protein
MIKDLARGITRICIFILCLALIAWLNPQVGKTKEGNRLYNDGLYDDAMTKYTESLVELPNSPQLHFNIGNAAYKKGDFEEAVKSYTKAASLATDPALENKAYYNLGNCLYRQGKLKENTSPVEAVSQYREALEHYKRALERNPEDKNAKYNHEFVERKIKELLDKQKQQQQQQQGQQNQKEKSEEQQGQQNQQSQQQSEQKDSEKKNAEQKEAQAAQEQPEDQKEKKGGQSSEKKEKLTAEEARMLLDSLSDEELSQLKKQRPRGAHPQVLKDW